MNVYKLRRDLKNAGFVYHTSQIKQAYPTLIKEGYIKDSLEDSDYIKIKVKLLEFFGEDKEIKK